MKETISRRRFLVAGASVLAAGVAALVGGTYAQYMTKDTKESGASVSPFGAKVEIKNSLFAKQYINKEGGNAPGSTNVTVSASSETLAPGTQSASGESAFQIALSGVSDVAVSVTFSVDGDTLSDVHLGSNYYPVLYTLTQTKAKASATAAVDESVVEGVDGSGATDNVLVNGGTLSKVAEELEKLNNTSVAAGKNLAEEFGTLTLTWVWPFGAASVSTDGGSGEITNNTVVPTATSTEGEAATALSADNRTTYDTYLGRLASGTTVDGYATSGDGANSSTKAKIDITVTVTQID
jgi:hypothetical protein